MKKRPVIKIEPTATDRKMDMAALVLTLLLVALPLLFYSQLPDRIPSHFGASGDIDGYGSKYTIWILAAIGVMTYALFRYLLQMPHNFNYLTPVNEENAESQYRSATKLMRYILIVTQAIFLIILIAVIYAALQPGKNLLGPWFTIGTILLTIIIPVYIAFKMSYTTK